MPEPLDTRVLIPVAEPLLGEREMELVAEAVRSGWVSSLGPFVESFEDALAALAGVRHALVVSNGTAALHLALAALDIGSGDEVIVPSFSFIATAAAVRYTGADPVFAEVDAAHWCLDPNEIERLVTPRTRAVMPVEIYGHPADMNAIRDLADSFDLLVLEDAAEAMGARYRGRAAGALGDVGVSSFYGNKVITTGEGGVLWTDRDDVAERARILRDHAMDPTRRYWHNELGFNYRMTNIQAALGVAQLERLEYVLARKRAIAARYREGLAEVTGLQFQHEAAWAESSWWMITVRVLPEFGIDRDLLAAELREKQIDSRPTFAPIHLMPPFASRGVSLPHTEALALDGLTLPSSATLTDEQQDRVISTIRKAYRA